jgi:hypothetical protein
LWWRALSNAGTLYDLRRLATDTAAAARDGDIGPDEDIVPEPPQAWNLMRAAKGGTEWRRRGSGGADCTVWCCRAEDDGDVIEWWAWMASVPDPGAPSMIQMAVGFADDRWNAMAAVERRLTAGW